MASRFSAAVVFSSALTALAACQTSNHAPVERTREAPRSVPAPVSTSTSNRQTFASPQEALAALGDAAKKQDAGALRGLFGPDIDQVVSKDEVEQKAALQRFSDRLAERAHVETAQDGRSANIYIGANDYPFPIPLVKDPSGKWFFDTRAGQEEIINRRIGRNELDTIDTLHVFADAQRMYGARDHDDNGVTEYARRLVSSQGKHDGLYWPATLFEPQSPLGPLAAQASAEGYPVNGQAGGSNGPHPFHGYYYRILTRQGPAAKGGAYNYVVNGHMVGGFAFLAYPAEYGKSGVMTFMINQDNTVYQKDLGEATEAHARAVASFNPDKSWTAVKDTPAAAPQPAPLPAAEGGQGGGAATRP
jgi:hypothetical protein